MMRGFNNHIVILTFIFALFSGGLAAHAATGPWQGGAEVQLRLISASIDHDLAGNDYQLDAALEVKLAKGWKIYWRSPGDAGLPPELNFTASPAVTGHRMLFPAPERFNLFGLDTFGYGEHVIFPLVIDVDPDMAAGHQKLILVADFNGLVCADICIPIEETLTMAVASGDGYSPSDHAFAIAQARSQVPSQATGNGYHIKTASIINDQLEVVIGDPAGMAYTMRRGDILIEAEADGYGFAAPVFREGKSQIAITGLAAAPLIGVDAVVTVIHPDFLIEQQISIEKGAAGSMLAALFPILLFAFLGGLILNIMPCVLPVLSLKLTSILKQSDASPIQIRRSFLMSAAGIILSFMVLGGGLLSMRSAGLAIGWGIQFQNPVFLGIMMVLMAGFALMMIDRVILPVPDFARRWSGKLTTGTGGWHDMASGALATILATPCSAPFVGTAIAFAFTAPSFAMLIIFLAMGLGLAAPWLCVAMFPQLAGYLPRPGKWLIYVRQALAIGLLATAIWLGFVLATVITDAPSSYSGNWQKWQPGLAEQYARNGDIVLVDVTADWCLTCKANKFLVLDLKKVQDVLDAKDVVLLKADWTKPDDDILDYLSSFGRYGIPFNIVYGPDALDGITLPELLTEESLLVAIETANLKPNSEKHQ